MGPGAIRQAARAAPALDPVSDRSASERGVALLVTLIVMVLLTALGLAVTLLSSTERQVAAAHRRAVETFYLADALLAGVVHDLAGIADWNHALDGTRPSSLVDAQAGSRRRPDGTPLDLASMTGQLTCGRPSCTTAEADATTAERPWGPNNPRWRLFAYGPAAALDPSGPIDPTAYVVAWVGDDPLETDSDPLRDGDTSRGPNPGTGRLLVLVHALGPGGARQVLAATVARGPTGVRVVAWRTERGG